MKIIDADESVTPVCPYCSKELSHVLVKHVKPAEFGGDRMRLVLCHHCKKVLGADKF